MTASPVFAARSPVDGKTIGVAVYTTRLQHAGIQALTLGIDACIQSLPHHMVMEQAP